MSRGRIKGVTVRIKRTLRPKLMMQPSAESRRSSLHDRTPFLIVSRRTRSSFSRVFFLEQLRVCVCVSAKAETGSGVWGINSPEFEMLIGRRLLSREKVKYTLHLAERGKE
jgi:hypothetical protein